MGEEGAGQILGDWEGKARSEETGEEFQDTIGEAEESHLNISHTLKLRHLIRSGEM